MCIRDSSELVRKGTNPKEQKTAGKEECTVEVNRKTFKECALDWVKERATNNFWKNNVKGEANTLSRLSNHVFPKIGEKAIESIEPEDIRAVSYTHLDVYKRQTKWSLNWSLNFEFFLLSDHFEFGVFGCKFQRS